MTTFTDQNLPRYSNRSSVETEPKDDGLTTPEQQKISVFQYRSMLNQSLKKGAFGAVLDPMINHDCLTDMNKVVKH
jgi:hypothetical protein